MVTTTKAIRQEIREKRPLLPEAKWAVDFTNGSHVSIPWWDLIPELVDNAMQNAKENEPCRIWLTWDTRGDIRSMRAIDMGQGCSDPDAFLQPGRSGPNCGRWRSDTFGSGLFVVETKLKADMRIATDPGDGTIYMIMREIGKSSEADVVMRPASAQERADQRIPEGGGTSILFRHYRKAGPGKEGIERIASEIGSRYSSVLQSGELLPTITLNGVQYDVPIERRPELKELHKARLVVDGSEFDVEWGVTIHPVLHIGAALVYGCKIIEWSSEACKVPASDKKTGLGHFYAQITIPRSIGLSRVNILKSGTEEEAMSEVFTRCAELFQPQLNESRELCADQTDADVGSMLEKMLSSQDSTRKGPKDGDKDKRDFGGRDPEGIGIDPKNTGRKRHGKSDEETATKPRRRRGEAPDKLHVIWHPLGIHAGMVIYDPSASLVTLNQDNELMAQWKEAGDRWNLAQAAAGHIANKLQDLSPSLYPDFRDKSFEEIYRILMDRAARYK